MKDARAVEKEVNRKKRFLAESLSKQERIVAEELLGNARN